MGQRPTVVWDRLASAPPNAPPQVVTSVQDTNVLAAYCTSCRKAARLPRQVLVHARRAKPRQVLVHAAGSSRRPVLRAGPAA